MVWRIFFILTQNSLFSSAFSRSMLSWGASMDSLVFCRFRKYEVHTYWGWFRLDEGAYQDYLAGKL